MKKKIKVYDVLRILICLFVLFLIVFPFVWLILSTFKLQKDIIKWPPTLWPKAWTIKNYIQVWSRIPLADYIKYRYFCGSGFRLFRPSGFHGRLCLCPS